MGSAAARRAVEPVPAVVPAADFAVLVVAVRPVVRDPVVGADFAAAVLRLVAAAPEVAAPLDPAVPLDPAAPLDPLDFAPARGAAPDLLVDPVARFFAVVDFAVDREPVVPDFAAVRRFAPGAVASDSTAPVPAAGSAAPAAPADPPVASAPDAPGTAARLPRPDFGAFRRAPADPAVDEVRRRAGGVVS